MNRSDSRTTPRACAVSPAPMCWATCTAKPIAAAPKRPLKSQTELDTTPTEAVALGPSDPTMAVSIYCTSVSMSCWTIAGHDSARTAETSSRRVGVRPS